MSKHNKNRAQQTAGKAKSRGEQLLDEVDGASARMGEDIRAGADNMRDRAGRATTDAKTKARNKR